MPPFHNSSKMADGEIESRSPGMGLSLSLHAASRAVISYLAHEGSAVLDHLNGYLFWALFEDRFLVQTKLKQTDFASASSSLNT